MFSVRFMILKKINTESHYAQYFYYTDVITTSNKLKEIEKFTLMKMFIFY